MTQAQHLANKATEYRNSGDNLQAKHYIEQALTLEKENENYLHFLGLLEYQNNNISEAVKYISKAIEISPEKALFSYNLGVIYKSIGQLKEAHFQQELALNLEPNNTQYLNEIALVEIEQGDFNSAADHLKQALINDEHNPITLSNYAYLCRMDNKPQQAIKFASLALNVDPQSSSAYMNLGQALVMVNNIREGIKHIEKSGTLGDKHILGSLQSSLLYSLYLADQAADETLKQHESFCQTYLNSCTQKSDNYSGINEKKKLSIGLVSSDFRLHSVYYFVIALIKYYDKQNFTYYCYSGVPNPDAVTKEIKLSVDHWRDIHNKTAEEIVQQITIDDIDILIDLAGHTKGNYLPVFSARPAPLQISYIGYPFSTGLKSMDYKLVDESTDPTGATESHYSEKLLRLSPSCFCYTPGEEFPIINEPPSKKNNHITFGSFNKFQKLSVDILDIWADILLQTPNSKLILKNNQPISELLKNNILNSFLKKEVEQERIIFVNPTPLTQAHMHFYNNIDIALDTFPYNGTTTSCEALWMGVPVVTLFGNTHRSRVGYSILKTLGLENLAAENPEQYVERIVQLVNNIDTLKHYRVSLRETMKTSMLTQGEKFTKNFEVLLKEVWDQHNTQ